MEPRRNFVIHVPALAFVAILLLSATTYLQDRPVTAGAILLFFSVCYAAASLRTFDARFLYPAMILGVTGYFLFCSAVGIPSGWFPPLVVPPVFILIIGGIWAKRRKREDIRRTVTAGAELTVLLFTLIILWRISFFATELPISAGITFVSFGAVGFVKYVIDNTPSSLGVGFFSTVVSILFLSTSFGPYVSLWSVLATVLLGCVLLYLGVRIHILRGWADAAYGYAAGILALVAASLRSAGEIESLVLVLTAATVSLLLVRLRAIKTLQPYHDTVARARFVVAMLSVVAFATGCAVLVTLAAGKFPLNSQTILSSLLLSAVYLTAALLDGRLILKNRDWRVHFSVLFLCFSCLGAILWKAPPEDLEWYFLFAAGVPVVLLILASVFSHWKSVADTAMEATWVTAVIVCVVGAIEGLSGRIGGLILPVLLFFSFVAAMAATRKTALFAGIIVAISYGYYCLLKQVGVGAHYIGLVLVPLGFVFLVVAYFLEEGAEGAANETG